jgi:excisionase family DNA binding protein
MDGYLTVDKAARRLGRSIEQVRRYLREGKLGGRRIGQQWFIEEDALADWQAGRRERRESRVSEAVATYEARTMETGSAGKFKTLLDPKLMDEIEETARRIEGYAGKIDAVKLIREIREEH